MRWVIRRLLVVYGLFGALAILARWRHAPSPWLDGLLAAGAGATLMALGWRARAPMETSRRSEGTDAGGASSERALP
ncbi:MAG: hypothetical protein RL199_220 [Pseudomonadota bacterium]|jgi:hypothetical protein